LRGQHPMRRSLRRVSTRTLFQGDSCHESTEKRGRVRPVRDGDCFARRQASFRATTGGEKSSSSLGKISRSLALPRNDRKLLKKGPYKHPARWRLLRCARSDMCHCEEPQRGDEAILVVITCSQDPFFSRLVSFRAAAGGEKSFSALDKISRSLTLPRNDRTLLKKGPQGKTPGVPPVIMPTAQIATYIIGEQ
jgi:hypothetical protein